MVKRGPAGVVVCDGDDPPVPVPDFAVAAVDVTGAGDAFAAGYLLARADGTGPAGRGFGRGPARRPGGGDPRRLAGPAHRRPPEYP